MGKCLYCGSELKQSTRKQRKYCSKKCIYLNNKEHPEHERDKYVRRYNKVDRFYKTTRPCEETGCIEWVGAKTKQGYGHVHWDYKTVYSHRVSWEMENGEIPIGMLVLHKCDNPSCVNVDHLYLGTQKENMADRDKEGKRGNKKVLSFEIAQVIRELYNRGLRKDFLADVFGVSYVSIQRIVKNDAYSDDV